MRLTPKESEIQKAILEGLQAHKIFAFRLNTGTVKTSYSLTGGSRYFRAHSLGAGAADILALPETMVKFTNDSETITRCHALVVNPLWIECKTDKGKTSAAQDAFAQMVKERGHNYLIARCWDEVHVWLRIHKTAGVWR